MEKEELLSTCDGYDRRKDDWEFYAAAYGGTKKLVEWGVLRQFEDDIENFNNRKKAAFGFNYSKRIVNTLNDFLREIPFEEDFGAVSDDDLWRYFEEDCDLLGTNWENFWGRKRKWTSVFGHCGILVDKASGTFDTKRDEVELGIYPYLAYYSPLHILDWRFERDAVTNRPVLHYLKLYEDIGTVRILTRANWEVWKLPERSDEQPVRIASGTNPLKGVDGQGIIPFVWFGNGQDWADPSNSVSDITDIAEIDASIVRDASNTDEVVTNAAFPMLAVPKEEITEGGENTPVEIGPTRIIEFEPGKPGDKPFWLESKVKDCVDSMLKLWDKKSDEMYGMANLSIIREMSRSSAARSGDSQKESFRFLNSYLAEKVDSEIEARLQCVRYWGMWQGISRGELNKITIAHEKKFNAEKLLLTMEDAVKAKDVVGSDSFRNEVEKMIVRRVLGAGVGSEKMKLIEDEIDAEKEQEKGEDETKNDGLKINEIGAITDGDGIRAGES